MAHKWASERVSDSSVRKSAMMIVLSGMDTSGMSKKEICERLGISRWTLDRYRAEMPLIMEEVGRILYEKREGE